MVGYNEGSNDRFVDYRLVKWNDNKIELMGGGGGIAQTSPDLPFSFSSGGGYSNADGDGGWQRILLRHISHESYGLGQG